MALKKNKGSHQNYFACQILPISVQKEHTSTPGGGNNRKPDEAQWLEDSTFQRRENSVGVVHRYVRMCRNII